MAVAARARIHELVMVPAHPDQRLCTVGVHSVSLQEVRPGILRPKRHPIMLDAALPGQESMLNTDFTEKFERTASLSMRNEVPRIPPRCNDMHYGEINASPHHSAHKS